MVKTKLQMHNTMMVNATSAGLFPLQKVATLKRKTSESFPDDAFAKDSVWKALSLHSLQSYQKKEDQQ